MSQLTPIQQTAHTLHDMGLNIFPHLYGQHRKYYRQLWRRLLSRRLQESQLDEAFQGRCKGIAVIVGHTSQNLCILECKTDVAFKEQVSKFSAVTSHFWDFKLATGGQIWFFSDYPMSNQKWDVYAPDVYVNGKDRYVIVPPALTLPSSHLPEPLKKLVCNYLKIPVQFEWSSSGQSKSVVNHWRATAAYFATHWTFKGKEGQSDLAVFKALINIIQQHPRQPRTVRASHRQLAEHAHLDKDTVGEAIDRFKNSTPPLLVELEPAYDGATGTYRFSDEIIEQGRALLNKDKELPDNSLGNGTYTYVINLDNYYEDVIEAFGHYALLVHDVLNQKRVLQLREIKNRTRFPKGWLESALKKLLKYDLIEKVKIQGQHPVYKTLPKPNWQRVIDEAGVRGASDKRKQRHEAARQAQVYEAIIGYRKRADETNYNHP